LLNDFFRRITMELNKKIILTGSFGVGKTSLFSRFIYSEFDEKYLTTIGVKVDKKTINIDDTILNIMLWDIAGEVAQDKVPLSYFLGTSGIIYVFDLTRPMTYNNIATDIEYLKNILPEAVIKVIGNKKDLVTDTHIESVISGLSVECDMTTSAKTGENVEQLFKDIGESLL